jgi:hypothetical protein
MNRRESIVAIAAFGAVVRPIASFAQLAGNVRRVGFLSLDTPASRVRTTDAFLHGMRELGYVEGKDLTVEWRFADGKFERLPGLSGGPRAAESGRHRRSSVGRDRCRIESNHDDSHRHGNHGQPGSQRVAR